MTAESILHTIQGLNAKLDMLERTVETKINKVKAAAQQRPATPQRDLFAISKGPTANDISTTVLARKLDRAIEKVQGILKEAEG